MCTTISIDFDAERSLRPHPVHEYVLHPEVKIDEVRHIPCDGAPPAVVIGPVETLRALADALRRDDVGHALEFFAPSVRSAYAELLPRANLNLLVRSLDDPPPVRLGVAHPEDRYAAFITRRVIGDRTVDVEVTLHFEDGRWVVVGF